MRNPKPKQENPKGCWNTGSKPNGFHWTPIWSRGHLCGLRPIFTNNSQNHHESNCLHTCQWFATTITARQGWQASGATLTKDLVQSTGALLGSILGCKLEHLQSKSSQKGHPRLDECQMTRLQVNAPIPIIICPSGTDLGMVPQVANEGWNWCYLPGDIMTWKSNI